jgi:cobalt-zinc-cadmium efflux system protein
MLWLALLLTGTFLIAEVAGGILTGSLALISDAAHMLTDAVGLAIALAAIKIGQRPPDSRRTFGYQRFEILAAAFNALLLFAVGAYILWEGYRRFFAPPEIQSVAMLAVAALGLVINLVAMRLLSDGEGSSLNMRGAYLEVWSDLLGSIGVIAAAAIIWLTGWTWIDAVVAIGIGLWVLPRTWALLRKTLNVLLEGVPESIDIEAVASALRSLPGVEDIHDLHVWALTTDSPSLSAHLVRSPAASAEQVLANAAAMLGDRFKIRHVTLQIESNDCRLSGAEQGLH